MSHTAFSASSIPNLARRKLQERLFYCACLGATCLGLLLLVVLLYGVTHDAVGWLNLKFLQEVPSRIPQRSGVRPALFGTFWVIGLTGLLAVPVGVAAAIYLEEFAQKTRLAAFLQTNIANLAGVPSIVYGLLGLAAFVHTAHLGRSVLAGALTMSLLILPTVIIATQEALRAVPRSLRDASFGLGATRWQTIWHQVLPASFSGVMTGIILSLSRAIGETAPLITIGAFTRITSIPSTPMDKFTVLPIQIFNWTSMPDPDFRHVAAAAILVLLIVLLLMNSIAIFLRYRRNK